MIVVVVVTVVVVIIFFFFFFIIIIFIFIAITNRFGRQTKVGGNWWTTILASPGSEGKTV
jgi:hypothetical protein